MRGPSSAVVTKTEEQLRGEAMFWKWVRGTIYILVALIVCCYWYGEVVVRPALRGIFEHILQPPR